MQTSIERRVSTLLRSSTEGTEEEREFTRAAIRAHCADNIVDWCNDWLWTYDPRLIAMNEPAMVPFDLFPRQAEFMEWMLKRETGAEDGAVEKSRDMGITYLCGAYALHRWLFKPGFKTTFGSRTTDDVDELDNPDTILQKIRIMMRHLPWWMLPAGFNEGEHSRYMRIINPATGSAITGEGGKNMGRSGRSSMYIVDEGAFLEQAEMVDAAVTGNTDCAIWASTVNGMGNVFARKTHSGQIPVFRFHFTDDPRKDTAWEKEKRRTTDEHVFASEYDIDYSASVEGIIIPARWVASSEKLKKLIEVKPSFQGITGLDVGGGGKGASVAVTRKGPVVMPLESWGNPDTANTAFKGLEHARIHNSQHLNYDAPGIGAGVASTLKNADTGPMRVKGVNTGNPPTDNVWPDGRTAKEMFGNLKIELWWVTRERFQRSHELYLWLTGDKIAGFEHPIEDCIVLPDDCQKLITQLSSWTYYTNDKGKRMATSKPVMAKLGIRSPDEADALVLTMREIDDGEVFPMADGQLIVDPFEIPAHWPKVFGLEYTPTGTQVIWAATDPGTATTYLYTEHCREHADISTHADAMKARGVWVPGIVSAVGQGRTKKETEAEVLRFRQAGIKMAMSLTPVEADVAATWQKMSNGQVKVFSTCQDWREQFAVFRRDLNGKVMPKTSPLVLASCTLMRNGIQIAKLPPVKRIVGEVEAADSRAGY